MEPKSTHGDPPIKQGTLEGSVWMPNNAVCRLCNLSRVEGIASRLEAIASRRGLSGLLKSSLKQFFLGPAIAEREEEVQIRECGKSTDQALQPLSRREDVSCFWHILASVNLMQLAKLGACLATRSNRSNTIPLLVSLPRWARPNFKSRRTLQGR